jgi:uncharacterized protein YdgA (DUF945 family)
MALDLKALFKKKEKPAAPAPTAKKSGGGSRLVPVVGGLAGLVALAVAAGPYWFGMETETAYREMIEKAGRDGEVTVTIVRYDRGWLSSEAEVVFTLVGTPITVTVNDRLFHGPLPIEDFDLLPVMARIKSDITIAAKLPPPLTLKLPPINGNTVLNFDRTAKVHIEMAPAKFSPTEGSSFEWQGLSGDYEISADANNVKGSLTAPLLRMTGKQGETTLTRLTLASDQTRHASGIQLGSVNLGADSFVFKDERLQTRIDGMRFGTTTSEAGGNLTIGLSMQAAGITAGNEPKVGPLALAMQFRKLDLATILKLQKDARAMQKGGMPEMQAGMMMFGKMLESLGALAKKSPEMEITQFSFKTPAGELTGKGKLVLDGSQHDLTANPMLIVQALSGDGEVVVPEGMVKQWSEKALRQDLDNLKQSGALKDKELAKLTPERIASITNKALPQYMERTAKEKRLQREGSHYKVTMSLRAGELRVNNEPFTGGLPFP